MTPAADTIAALATPAGTAALIVVRVSGPDTLRLATAVAGSPPPPRRATHADYRDRTGVVLDDVVLVRYVAPRSYTAEDALEISCHGNPFIAQRILEDLLARGCRLAQPGEFTARAFLNGRIDLSQAEAVMDVIHARSERALAAAQQQLRGALGRRVQAAVDRLLDLLARLEAYIDFPEEDLPAEDRATVRAGVAALQHETGLLLATTHYGAILRDGIKTVIVGAPNVGKSSLLNRLVGQDRALVSPEPGTTRDFIEERILVGPHLLRLVDTAGLNPAPAALERLGMAKTLERAAEADLFLVVQDVTQSASDAPPEIAARLDARNTIIVRNKSDLPHPPAPASAAAGPPVIAVSAVTGAGIEELTRAIARCADRFAPALGDETIALSARHAEALGQAAQSLANAAAGLDSGAEIELVASDLRDALTGFGAIRGRVDNEEMLDKLFAAFCIGK